MKRNVKRANRASKTEMVLDYLKEHGEITSWEAIEKFGATRLSAIIYNLRKGHKIVGENLLFTDRYGFQSTYTKYIYCGEL